MHPSTRNYGKASKSRVRIMQFSEYNIIFSLKFLFLIEKNDLNAKNKNLRKFHIKFLIRIKSMTH